MNSGTDSKYEWKINAIIRPESKPGINSSSVSASDSTNWWGILLVFIPIATIFGNTLVVLAILTEKSLKTTTNLLLLSLAVADLLVGIIVMPFAIYLVVTNFNWYLPSFLCDIFIIGDVTASTASILHLTAISIDRFFAVVRHMEYQTAKHRRRIHIFIVLAWVFSFCLGLPLTMRLKAPDLISSNDDGSPQTLCMIENPHYMLYGSIFAFYIPSLVMIIMYGIVFAQLNRRLRAVHFQERAAANMIEFGQNIVAAHEEQRKSGKSGEMTWAGSMIRAIEETVQAQQDEELASCDEVQELTTILYQLESDRFTTADGVHAGDGDNGDNEPELELIDTRNENIAKRIPRRSKRKRLRFQIYRKNGSLASLLPTRRRASKQLKNVKTRAVELMTRLRSKQGMAIRKESRATKLVAIVMILFLLCWLPFFTLNLIHVHMMWHNPASWTGSWDLMFNISSWLGYFNSTLNPAIYSLINRKFRSAFQRLLGCGPVTDKRRRPISFPGFQKKWNRKRSAFCASHASRDEGYMSDARC